MGQLMSSPDEDQPGGEPKPTVVRRKFSRVDLEHQFDMQATRTFSRIQLFTLKNNLGLEDLDAQHRVSKDALFNLLGVPEGGAFDLKDSLFRSIQFLGRFPNLGNPRDDKKAEDENVEALPDYVTVQELIKAIAILDTENSTKLFGKRSVGDIEDKYQLTLALLGFASCLKSEPMTESKTEQEPVNSPSPNNIEVSIIDRAIQWPRDYDGIDPQKSCVDAKTLLGLVKFLLALAPISLEKNDALVLSKVFDFSEWDKFETVAFDILRAFDLTLSVDNYSAAKFPVSRITELACSHDHMTVRYLFKPLHLWLNSLFYDQKHPITLFKPARLESRILDPPRLAQLGSILTPELAFMRLQRLYVASQHGFSIRSLENKIFKWNAPTILFVRGRYINDAADRTKKLRKYQDFKGILPKFYPALTESHPLTSADDTKDGHKLLYMAYVKQPWRISNKEAFGDAETLLAELSCRQVEYPVSGFAENYAYFSNIGGGLGFGSKPPLVKNGVKVYHPGEVSLTLENNLEIGYFRHLGVPGTFKNGSCLQPIPEYESYFDITEIEVWGCGSEAELEEQKKRWEWENREAAARQGLNSMNWDDGKALLEIAGLVGGGQSGGSV